MFFLVHLIYLIRQFKALIKVHCAAISNSHYSLAEKSLVMLSLIIKFLTMCQLPCIRNELLSEGLDCLVVYLKLDLELNKKFEKLRDHAMVISSRAKSQ